MATGAMPATLLLFVSVQRSQSVLNGSALLYPAVKPSMSMKKACQLWRLCTAYVLPGTRSSANVKSSGTTYTVLGTVCNPELIKLVTKH